jgi:DNA-binding NarL/FixJ family response regulator
MHRVPVAIHAEDPIVHAGLTVLLKQHSELELVDEARQSSASVLVLCVDGLDESALTQMCKWSQVAALKTVLVVNRMRESELLDAIECGATVVVWRREATSDRIVKAIQVAERGEGDLPADLLGGLITQVGRARRAGGSQGIVIPAGISDREADIVRLIAEGLDTHEIAVKLCYSERTVKNVLHGLMTRMHLRNRAHAVAYAAREGYLR